MPKAKKQPDNDIEQIQVLSRRAVLYEGERWPAFEITTTEQLIRLCRGIVRRHQCAFMLWDYDVKGEPQRWQPLLIDAYSASMILLVVDNLKPENRARLETLDPIVAVDRCMTVCAGVRSGKPPA